MEKYLLKVLEGWNGHRELDYIVKRREGRTVASADIHN